MAEPFIPTESDSLALKQAVAWIQSFKLEGDGVKTRRTADSFQARIDWPRRAPPPVAAGQMQTLKILDVYGSFMGGAGAGSYQVGIGVGSVNAIAGNRNFRPPDPDMTFPTDPDAVWRNLFESGSAAAGTNLLPVGRIVYGYPTGDNEDGLPVYYGSTAPPGTVFRVKLVQSSGSDGDASTPASWKYDVYTYDNSWQIAADVAIETGNPRPNGKRTKATAGQAYLDKTGAVILTVAYEIYGTGSC